MSGKRAKLQSIGWAEKTVRVHVHKDVLCVGEGGVLQGTTAPWERHRGGRVHCRRPGPAGRRLQSRRRCTADEGRLWRAGGRAGGRQNRAPAKRRHGPLHCGSTGPPDPLRCVPWPLTPAQRTPPPPPGPRYSATGKGIGGPTLAGPAPPPLSARGPPAPERGVVYAGCAAGVRDGQSGGGGDGGRAAGDGVRGGGGGERGKGGSVASPGRVPLGLRPRQVTMSASAEALPSAPERPAIADLSGGMFLHYTTAWPIARRRG